MPPEKPLAAHAADRIGSLLKGKIPAPLPREGLTGADDELADSLNQLIDFHREILDFIVPLSRGEVTRNVPKTRNFLASPFKELHSRIMHLIWQAKQVAEGDYHQRVDFMGDFAEAFNFMVESLDRHERQRKERIAELESLNEQKNSFLGMAAHDLRNPLAVLELYSSYLAEGASERLSEREVEFLEIIRKQSRFMLRLINDLLDVSKIESGTLELELEDEDYLEFLRHNVLLNSAIASRKYIQIAMEDAEGPLPLSFDRGKMEQVLNNLIGNAIKFSPAQSTITVSVRAGDSEVTTSVSDQGEGVPSEEIPHLFKEFHRGTVRPTGGERSTGLGLAIARRIVERHGGTVGAASEVGRGSRFYFSLPLRRP